MRNAPERRRFSCQPFSNEVFGPRQWFQIAAAFRSVVSPEHGGAECESPLHSWARWHRRVHSVVRAGLATCKCEFGFMTCRQWMRRSLPKAIQQWHLELRLCSPRYWQAVNLDHWIEFRRATDASQRKFNVGERTIYPKCDPHYPSWLKAPRFFVR